MSHLVDCKGRIKRNSSVNVSGVIFVLFLPEISARSSASQMPWEHRVPAPLKSHWFEVGGSEATGPAGVWSLFESDNSAYKASLLDPLVICCASVGAAN